MDTRLIFRDPSQVLNVGGRLCLRPPSSRLESPSGRGGSGRGPRKARREPRTARTANRHR